MELLAMTWYMIIGFGIIMYVLLDGFDLGIGILFPFFNKNDKSLMISTILPVWDGNQTWLVFGVACLYGAFPLAFSLLIPALYLPLFTMVIALLLRGITFEFRLKETQYQHVWNFIFFLSSTTVTFVQGLLLGSFVKGFDVDSQSNLIFSLFTPFNFCCGIALLFGYSLLGATWTIHKTIGKIQQKMFKVAFICLIATTFFLGLVSLWSPFIDPMIWGRWFGNGHFYILFPLPAITGALILYFLYCLRKKYEHILYWLAVGIFLCCYIGFGVSTWPYIIPHYLTAWEASAPLTSQLFMLIGTLLLLPVLVGYTSYAYYIFRGKVNEELDYEQKIKFL